MSVRPARYDDELQKRARYFIELKFEDNKGDPIDLTGWTVDSEIWNVDRSVKYLDFTVTYTNRTNGQVTLSLTDVQTATLATGSYYYDVLLIDLSGNKDHYIKGTLYAAEGYTT